MIGEHNKEMNQTSKTVIPEWLLPLLRCPNSGSSLRLATREELVSLQSDAIDGKWRTRLGGTISQLPSQGLLSDDECWLYPIVGGIPVLVPGEAIEVGGARNEKSRLG